MAESVAKLQLDPETGEMVSKNELKKRMQKRAKKAAVAAAPKKAAPANPKPKAHADEASVDPDAMFKQGFLADVFRERPVTPTVTRFPPEPNGLSAICPERCHPLTVSVYISATRRLLQLHSASPSSMAARRFSVSTTPTPTPRKRGTLWLSKT